MEWKSKAYELLGAGEGATLLAHLRGVAALEDSEFHWLMGAAFMSARNFSQAGVHYREAVRLAPEDAMSALSLAQCLLAHGEREEAAAAFRRVRELDPSGAVLDTLALARFLAKAGDAQGAVECYEQLGGALQAREGYILCERYFHVGEDEKGYALGVQHALAQLAPGAAEADFWRTLNPQLSVSQGLRCQAPARLAFERAEELRGKLRREGYFQLDAFLASELVGPVRVGIERLRQAGIAPVNILVYDQVWTLLAALDHVLEAVMGPGYQRLPQFWAWFIDPELNQSGWAPHLDRPEQPLRADGLPVYLNLWVALSAATADNGCMHLVPMCDDPGFLEPGPARQVHFQNARVLACPAGSVLCWNGLVHHWGGKAFPGAAEPRISLANDYQRGDHPALEKPLYNPLQPPDFQRRLGLLGVQLLRYACN